MNRNFLLIGNINYINKQKLPFVDADLSMMEDVLNIDRNDKKIVCKDLTDDEIRNNITDFVTNAQRESLNIIYFSGHGGIIKGKNYIYGVDDSLESLGITYNEIFDIIIMHSFLSKFLVIIDACRNNGMFSDLNVPDNVCLLCSSQVSQTSSGNIEKGSDFTKCFVEVLKKEPYLPLRVFLLKVLKEFDLTSSDQTPIILDRILEDDIYLTKPKYISKTWKGINQIDKIIYDFVYQGKEKDVFDNMVFLSYEYDIPLLLVNYYFEYYQFYKSNLEPFGERCSSTVFWKQNKDKFKFNNGKYYYNEKEIEIGELPDFRIGDPKKSKIIETDITAVCSHINNDILYIKISTKIIDGYILQIQSNLFNSFLQNEIKGGQVKVSIPLKNCKVKPSKGSLINIIITSPVVEVQRIDIKKRILANGRNLYGNNIANDEVSGRTIYYKKEIKIM